MKLLIFLIISLGCFPSFAQSDLLDLDPEEVFKKNPPQETPGNQEKPSSSGSSTFSNPGQGDSCTREVSVIGLNGTYKGECHLGKPDGRGRINFFDGTEYTGEVVAGQFDGFGRLIGANGAEIIGEWKNNKLHGSATVNGLNGYVFEGTYLNGKKHGSFEIKTPSVDVEVNYSNGEILGDANLNFKNGITYIGEINESYQMHGRGIAKRGDSQIIGEFSNGHFVQSESLHTYVDDQAFDVIEDPNSGGGNCTIGGLSISEKFISVTNAVFFGYCEGEEPVKGILNVKSEYDPNLILMGELEYSNGKLSKFRFLEQDENSQQIKWSKKGRIVDGRVLDFTAIDYKNDTTTQKLIKMVQGNFGRDGLSESDVILSFNPFKDSTISTVSYSHLTAIDLLNWAGNAKIFALEDCLVELVYGKRNFDIGGYSIGSPKAGKYPIVCEGREIATYTVDYSGRQSYQLSFSGLSLEVHRQQVDNREEPVYVNVESRTKKYSCSLPGRDGYNFCEYKVAGKYHIVGLVGNPYGDSYDEIVDASIMREGVIKFPNGAMMKGEIRPPFTYSNHLIGEGGLDRDRPKFNSRKLHGGSAGSSSTDNNPILKNTSGQIRVCEDDLEARCYFRDGSRVKVEEYNDFAEATSKAEKTKRQHIVSDPYQSSDEILRVLRDNAPELIF